MLVLARKVGQRIRIADEVEITILEVAGKKVRIGVSAPCDIPIFREEVYKRLEHPMFSNQGFETDSSEDETICEMELVGAH